MGCAESTSKVGDKECTCACHITRKREIRLWERYSTKLVAHTIKTYSKYTVDYPYPVAISVHARSNRYGIPNDLFQWWSDRNADGTYSEGHQIRYVGRDYPRSGSQLLPDDHQLRRTSVDLDG